MAFDVRQRMKTPRILIVATSWISIAIGAEPDVPVRPAGLPQVPSRLDLHAVKALLEKGITDGELTKKINTLPIVRIGPGYVLYILSDGHLVTPLYEGDSEVVREWKLTPNQKPKAEQGVAPQSATRPESESEGGDNPQPESKPRPR